MAHSGNSFHTHIYKSFPPWLEKTFDCFLGSVLLIELIVLFGNIVLRAVTGQSIVWANEIAGLALSSLAFIGGAIAYHRGVHTSVRVILGKLSVKLQIYGEAIGNWVVLLLAVLGVCLAFPVFASAWDDRTYVLEMRKSWLYLPFAIGMVLLAVFAFKRLLCHKLRTNIVAGFFVLAVGLIWFIAQYYTGPWNGLGGIGFAGILVLLLVFSGVPIGFVLPSVALLYLYGAKSADLMAVPLAMQNGISSFIMLAIPFFILAGNIMTEGGLAQPLADWVCTIVGHLRGGLMQAVIVAMYIFSGISGSKVADVAAVGTPLRGMLKTQGYQPAESTAVFAAAAVMGETIPPSLGMMVLASITTLSVGSLFIAGLLPATLIALCLMGFIFIRAWLKGWPRCEKTSWSTRAKVTVMALPALLVPLILIVGIVGGIATPTEVSSFAVVYAILIGILLYKGINFHNIVPILGHAGITAGMILFIISAGGAFSWTLTIAGLPNYIGSWLKDLGGSVIIFQLASILALAVMGMLLEGLPSLLVFGPMLLPIAVQYGINPMHYSLILILAMGVGSFLPPFGLGFYVTCSVLESTLEETSARLLPYFTILILGILLVTFVPWFSLALPNALHLSIK